MTEEENELIRLCPNCGEKITYKNKYLCRSAKIAMSHCFACRVAESKGRPVAQRVQTKVGYVPSKYTMFVIGRAGGNLNTVKR